MVSTYYLVKLLQNANSGKTKMNKNKQHMLPIKFSPQNVQGASCTLNNELLENANSRKTKRKENKQQMLPNKFSRQALQGDTSNKNQSSKFQPPGKIKKGCLSEAQVISRNCRVCLKPGTVPIFFRYHNRIPISLFIKLICDIDLAVNDIYPQYLCDTCFITLKAAIKLRNTAKKTQNHLRKLYPSSQNTSNNCDKLKIGCKPSTSAHKKEEESTSESEVDFDYADTKIKRERDSVQAGVKDETLQQTKEESLDLKNTTEINIDQYAKYFDKLKIDGKGLFYRCHICKNTYRRHSRPDHLKTHIPNLEPQFVCEVCGKTYKKQCILYQHKRIHTNTLQFHCNQCPYKGRTKENLKVHVKRMHIKAYNYQCDQCPEKFIDSQALRNHIARHGEPKFKCSSCDRSYYRNAQLQHHIKTRHINADPKAHKCDICGNFYLRRKNLLVHQIKVHKRKKVPNSRADYLRLGNVNVTDELPVKS